jgi:hypothetical protein
MAYNANDGLARLAPLHDLKDFKVANHNLDVRGWEVIGSDGTRIGKVDDLIVDRELMKVRYLDVDVDRDHVLTDTDPRHILVPIGAAQLDDDRDQVFVSMDQRSLARFPFYKGGAVDSEYEYRVMHAVTSPNETYTQPQPTTSQVSPTSEFYGREQFNEDRFYANRHQRSQSIPQDQSHFHTPNSGMDGRPVQEDIATIERLRAMLEQGTITQEEFTALKRKAIGL